MLLSLTHDYSLDFKNIILFFYARTDILPQKSLRMAHVSSFDYE